MSHKRKSKRPNHMTPDERDECIQLYRDGSTRNYLAALYDRDLRTVERLITRRGAQRRRAPAMLGEARPSA